MAPAAKKFRVRLERPEDLKRGANFRVPPSIMAVFAPRKRVPVVVTINGFSYRTTIAPYGGDFYIIVRSEICAKVGVDAGDTVDVAVALDTAERTVDVPRDLAKALEAAKARATFDALAYTSRKEFVRAVEEAKRPETRERRIAAAVERVVEQGARWKR